MRYGKINEDGYRLTANRLRLAATTFQPACLMDSVRLDLWLWTARFFKTRALAAAAIDSGKVELNGHKTKRGKAVRPGDALRVRLGPYAHHLTVLGLSRRRGPAAEASALYQETVESAAARARLAEQYRLAATLVNERARGRPSKRDRRELQKLKDRER